MKNHSLFALLAFMTVTDTAMAQPTVPSAPAVPNAVLNLPAQRKVQAPATILTEQLQLPGRAFPDIQVRGVHIVGAQALPASEIGAAFADLIGKTATSAQLQAALDKVGALYTKAGYALGRAYIPAQQIENGVLTVRILEGYIGAVVVKTETPRVKDTIAGYAQALTLLRPLRSDQLHRTLRLIAEIPGVTVSAQLTDMDPKTGAAALVLAVTYQPLSASIALGARGNVRGLPVQPYLTLKANDLIGTGDQFVLTSLLSPVPKEGYFEQLAASTSIGHNGLRIASITSISKARADIQPSNLNLSATQLRSEMQASYPLVKSAEHDVTATSGSYFSQLEYTLNGRSLAKDRAVAVYGEITESAQPSAVFARSLTARVTFGTALPFSPPISGSRTNATRDYAKINLDGAVSYAPTEHISLLVRAAGQVATGSLMAAEEISFGGDRFGRGYDAGMISGDRGIGASIQPQYGFELMPGWNASAFVFADYAQVYNTRGDFQANGALQSAGGGLGLSHDGYSVTLGIAQPLVTVAGYNMRLTPRLFGSFQVKL